MSQDAKQNDDLSPLLKLVDMSWKIAASFITNNKDELMTQFIAETRDGSLQFYSTPWGNEEEKVIVLDLLRKKFAEEGVVRYVLTSEVWRVRYAADDARLKDEDRPMPSQDPQRESALMVIGVDPAAGEVLHYGASIIEGDDGRSLGERQTEQRGQMGGRMINLLGPFSQRTVN